MHKRRVQYLKCFVIILILSVSGCAQKELSMLRSENADLQTQVKELSALRSQNADLKVKIAELEAGIDSLHNTASYRFAKAAELEKYGWRNDEAVREYEMLIDLYPLTEEAKQAKTRLAALKEDIKQQEIKEKFAEAVALEESNYYEDYEEALQAYKELITSYPHSKEAKEAKRKIVIVKKAIQKAKKEEARRAYLESIKPPLEFVRAWVSFNVIGDPEARLIVRNISTKTVDAYTVGIYCHNRYGKPVRHYLTGSNRFGGLSQTTISPGEKEGVNRYWTLYGLENTAKIKCVLENVHMTDGSVWKPRKGQKVFIWGESSR